MADIAETLETRAAPSRGARSAWPTILEARDKHEEALKVYERALAIAPHWRSAEKAADRLKAAIAAQEL